MGGSWDIRNMNCEPGNQNDWPKETRKKCPLKVIQLPQGRNSVALSLSESAHVPMHVSQINRPVVSDSLWPRGLQHARLPCLSLSPGVCSNSCPLSRWCHPTNSSSVIPFSSGLQSFPALGSLMSQFIASGTQSIGPSALASILPVNTQDWFLLGSTGLIPL